MKTYRYRDIHVKFAVYKQNKNIFPPTYFILYFIEKVFHPKEM